MIRPFFLIRVLIGGAALVLLVVSAVRAADAFDHAVSALCTAPMAPKEEALAIPRHLLEAISLVESGRWDAAAERTRPWPWTVYAKGAGHRYETKEAAIAAVAALKKAGVRNIDVGCMQVNLRYHPEAFASLDEAFDPAANVAYAAHFLKDLRDRRGSWPEAIRHYHSATPAHARPYHVRVTMAWADARRHAAEMRRHAAEARRQARLERHRTRRASARRHHL